MASFATYKNPFILGAGRRYRITASGARDPLTSIAPNVAVLAASTIRPADTTAYASGDLVANSVTAGSVVPFTFVVGDIAGATCRIRRLRLRKNSISVTNAAFRVHFYRASPICANGDNAAWSTDSFDQYVGFIDVTMDKAFTDGATGFSVVTEINFTTVATSIYCLVEARGAYTPVSAETITLVLEYEQG